MWTNSFTVVRPAPGRQPVICLPFPQLPPQQHLQSHPRAPAFGRVSRDPPVFWSLSKPASATLALVKSETHCKQSASIFPDSFRPQWPSWAANNTPWSSFFFFFFVCYTWRQHAKGKSSDTQGEAYILQVTVSPCWVIPAKLPTNFKLCTVSKSYDRL